MANDLAEDLESRIAGILQSMFKLPPSVANGALRMGAVQGWDSLGHMRLVNELEKVFGITFPSYMLTELTDVPGIARAVSSLGDR